MMRFWRTVCARGGLLPFRMGRMGKRGGPMLKRRLQLASAVALGALLAAGSANAQSGTVSADQISKLEAQIKALQDQVGALKSKVSKAEQSYATAPDPSTARA